MLKVVLLVHFVELEQLSVIYYQASFHGNALDLTGDEVAVNLSFLG